MHFNEFQILVLDILLRWINLKQKLRRYLKNDWSYWVKNANSK
jgi:hypothetical protein